MEEYAELRAQRLVGACESGRLRPHAHLAASGRRRTTGGSGRRVLAHTAPRRGGARCFAALLFFFPGPGRIPQVASRRASRSLSSRFPLYLICPPILAVCELPLTACLSPLTVWPTQRSRQNAPLAFGVCHSTLLPVGPTRHRVGGAVPPALVSWFSLRRPRSTCGQRFSFSRRTRKNWLLDLNWQHRP